jgi:hypothetical protein
MGQAAPTLQRPAQHSSRRRPPGGAPAAQHVRQHLQRDPLLAGQRGAVVAQQRGGARDSGLAELAPLPRQELCRPGERLGAPCRAGAAAAAAARCALATGQLHVAAGVPAIKVLGGQLEDLQGRRQGAGGESLQAGPGPLRVWPRGQSQGACWKHHTTRCTALPSRACLRPAATPPAQARRPQPRQSSDSRARSTCSSRRAASPPTSSTTPVTAAAAAPPLAWLGIQHPAASSNRRPPGAAPRARTSGRRPPPPGGPAPPRPLHTR